MLPNFSTDPANMAPVFPADANPSIAPAFNASKPLEMLESGFSAKARTGLAAISIT